MNVSLNLSHSQKPCKFLVLKLSYFKFLKWNKTDIKLPELLAFLLLNRNFIYIYLWWDLFSLLFASLLFLRYFSALDLNSHWYIVDVSTLCISKCIQSIINLTRIISSPLHSQYKARYVLHDILCNYSMMPCDLYFRVLKRTWK